MPMCIAGYRTKKAIFSSACSDCHYLIGNIDGPRLQDMMAMRSTQWIYNYLTDRKFRENDALHQRIKKAFDGAECPLFLSLTKQDVVALSYYIASQ